MEGAKEILADLMIEYGALKFGDFTLASGKKSDYYIDGRLITLSPDGATLIGAEVAEIISTQFPEAEAVGGMIAGAVPIAVAAAIASGDLCDNPLSAFMVRKEIKKHGTQKMVEGPVKPGQKVVMVDDVITTGGSTVQAIEYTIEYGCEVLGIVSVVDREDVKLDSFLKYRHIPILTITELRKLAGK